MTLDEGLLDIIKQKEGEIASLLEEINSLRHSLYLVTDSYIKLLAKYCILKKKNRFQVAGDDPSKSRIGFKACQENENK